VSAEATFWAWMMGVKPATAKLTLMLLADCHNAETGRCDPSTKFICEFTGLDKKTVPACIETLESMGLIRKVRRPGGRPQFSLLIAENPVPAREKNERRRVVPFARPKQLDLPRNRVYPKTGTPENGYPENGHTTLPENGDTPIPDFGDTPYPKTGYEPRSNLQAKPHSDLDKSRSGAGAPIPVDNSLGALDRLYAADNPCKAVFDAGVRFLGQYGHPERSARSLLAKLLMVHGESATVDAMVKAMIFEPVDPAAWIREVLGRGDRASPISMDWAPPDEWVENAIQPVERGGHGIPMDLIRRARDAFVVWFSSTGIPHHDFLGLFERWCVRDWERAQHNRAAYLGRLAAATGGMGEYVHFAT